MPFSFHGPVSRLIRLARPRHRLLLLRTLRLLAEIWRFGRFRLLMVMAQATAAAAAEGVGILMIPAILDRLGLAGAAPPFPGLELALSGYFVLVAAAAMTIAGRQIAAARLGMEFVDHLRRELHGALLAMDWPAFSRLRQSDLNHGVAHDVDITLSGVEFLLSLGGSVVQLIAAGVVVATLAPSLIGVALLAAILLWPLGGALNRRLYRLGQEAGLAWQRLNAALMNDLAGFRLIKIFGLAAARRERFAQTLSALRAREMAVQAALARNSVASRTLAALAACTVLLLAVRLFQFSPARSLALMVALGRLAQVSARLLGGWRHVVHALPAHARVRALLARAGKAAEADTAPAASPPARMLPGIRLEGVVVHHDRSGPPAPDDISFALPPGVLVAVVGPSGAGKSTLGNLLLGLLAPSQGRILIDEVPLTAADRPAWRRQTSFMPQDPLLFNDTIAANLRLADPSATDAELWRALAAAGAGDFVARLPRGLDSIVGDQGGALSGGEAQRLALARALLRRPALLVLDEPTGALDAATEAQVLASLRTLRGQTTILLITHRPDAIRDADIVVRLERGRLEKTASGVKSPASPPMTVLPPDMTQT